MQGSLGQRRVRIMFEDHPPRDYRAEATTAEEFATFALMQGAIVIVDNKVHESMPQLHAAAEWPVSV